MNHLPVIQLTVQGMEHTIKVALERHAADMDQYVQEAIEQYCEPENIRAVVHQTAKQEIDRAVKSCIEGFFRYGRGRAAIKKAVEEELAWWDEMNEV